MGVYIPNMEKPKDSCWDCKAQYNSVCSLKREHIKWDGILDDCPLIEIPTPHGRLIDGEKLCYEFIDWQYAEAPDHLNTKEGRMVTDHERQYEVYLALGEAVIEIANASTILEAEE